MNEVKLTVSDCLKTCRSLHKNLMRNFFLILVHPKANSLPPCFQDYTIQEFKQIADELDVEFIFNIVVAGGSSYLPCTSYLDNIVGLNQQNFSITICINEFSFQNYKSLVAEIESYAKANSGNIRGVNYFGDFDTDAAPHKNILRYISEGKGMNAYVFIEKIKIKKELQKLP